MPETSEFGPGRRWVQKFVHAFRGTWMAVRDNNSFQVHLLFAAGVIVAAVLLHFEPLRWCVLCLCIGAVFVAEMFNTALEEMAKAVDQQYNAHLRDALDISSAAVLMIAMLSVAIGVILFLPPLWKLWG